jgi:hypothetical protein
MLFWLKDQSRNFFPLPPTQKLAMKYIVAQNPCERFQQKSGSKGVIYRCTKRIRIQENGRCTSHGWRTVGYLAYEFSARRCNWEMQRCKCTKVALLSHWFDSPDEVKGWVNSVEATKDDIHLDSLSSSMEYILDIFADTFYMFCPLLVYALYTQKCLNSLASPME